MIRVSLVSRSELVWHVLVVYGFGFALNLNKLNYLAIVGLKVVGATFT